MLTHSNTSADLKSALFVDFDNIYLGLRDIDPNAAEVFATEPGRWLAWLEKGMPAPDQTNGAAQLRRSILVRRCYLNPTGALGRYRPHFTRSAFSVIDCPPLTAQAKNSADIHMVMDVLDTLEHRTHFDEFIILSGDSDFTPVLLRLRAHDRRTLILNLGLAAEAYKAASTQAISADAFLEDGLGVSAGVATDVARAAAAPPAAASILDAMAQALYTQAATNGEVPAHDLPAIFKEFPEFRNGRNWLGYFSLRNLTSELVRRQPGLRLVEGDIWRVTLAAATPARPEAAQPAATLDTALRDQIVAVVQQVVAASPEPVVLAKAAQLVIERVGTKVLETRWAGAGSFGALLEIAASPRLKIVTGAETPGHVYDPTRHTAPQPAHAGAADQRPDTATLERRISQVTGTPRLTPQQYTLVFNEIAKDLGRSAFDLNTTAKSVRDQCAERGEAIARANVSFILRGIIYAGFKFGPPSEPPEPADLARAFRNNVVNLCHAAQLALTEEELARLDQWILGDLGKAPG